MLLSQKLHLCSIKMTKENYSTLVLFSFLLFFLLDCVRKYLFQHLSNDDYLN